MKTSIIVLGTIFLFSIVSFSQPKQKFHKKNFKNDIIEKLNLTDEQEDKFSELRTSHKKEMIDLKADLEKKMVDMKELKKNPDLTRAELISAVESINSVKNTMAISQANHKMDVLELLNDEQKKIWLEQEPFRDHMKMKFKERSFGFGDGEFRSPPHNE